jgi:hypothetical protein
VREEDLASKESYVCALKLMSKYNKIELSADDRIV